MRSKFGSLKLGLVSIISICVCLAIFTPVASALVVTTQSDGDAWTQSVSFAGGSWAAFNWAGYPTVVATVETSDVAKVGTKSIRLNSVGDTMILLSFNPPVDVSDYDSLKVWFKTSSDWQESVSEFRLFDTNYVHMAKTNNVYIFKSDIGHDWYEITIPKSQWTDADFDGSDLSYVQFGA